MKFLFYRGNMRGSFLFYESVKEELETLSENWFGLKGCLFFNLCRRQVHLRDEVCLTKQDVREIFLLAHTDQGFSSSSLLTPWSRSFFVMAIERGAQLSLWDAWDLTLLLPTLAPSSPQVTAPVKMLRYSMHRSQLPTMNVFTTYLKCVNKKTYWKK